MHPALIHFEVVIILLALSALLAATTRLPGLPMYLLFGLLVSWLSTTTSLITLDIEQLQPLPDLGLILLLFSVGLEFGPSRLMALSGRALRAGLWDAVALAIGWLIGMAIGLDWRGALLLGGIFYVSSSAVIARLIIDLKRAAYPESEVVLGVLVFEDMVIAATLALTAGETGASALLMSLALVALYLVAAQWLGPHLHARLEGMATEPLLLLGTAFTVGTALLFHEVGASEGIGAFLAGTVLASIGMRERIEDLFGPIRDLAAALFFFAVGVTAAAALDNIDALAIALVVGALLLKLPLNYRSGVAAGLGKRASWLTALYLIPRGEFTLVLGAIALQDGYRLVSQMAVLLVLISIPVGALAIQAGPRLTRRLHGHHLVGAAQSQPSGAEHATTSIASPD